MHCLFTAKVLSDLRIKTKTQLPSWYCGAESLYLQEVKTSMWLEQLLTPKAEAVLSSTLP